MSALDDRSRAGCAVVDQREARVVRLRRQLGSCERHDTRDDELPKLVLEGHDLNHRGRLHQLTQFGHFRSFR